MEEPASYHIVYKHWRYSDPTWTNLRHYQRGETPWTPQEKGGLTKCWVYGEHKEVLATGTALCSVKDAFCYRIGRDISRGRAMKKLERTV